MNRKVRIAHFGVGKMGSIMLRYELEKGGQLVAAFDQNPAIIGKDAGEVIGASALGVPISNIREAAEVLARVRPDICTVTTRGTLPELKEIFEVCARAGANVLTIGEQAAWPWTEEPELAAELDALAKECGISIVGSGYPDIIWGSLVTTLAASSMRIDRIIGSITYDLDDYGPDFLRSHGIGMSYQDFREQVGEETITELPNGRRPCMPGDQNGWLCNKLGLTVKSQVVRHVPEIRDVDVYSHTLQERVVAGNVAGSAVVVHTETEEGITIEISVRGMLYAEGECDTTSWRIEGEPNTTIELKAPVTAAITCATPINRIPDVMNAPAGYITSNLLPPNRYMVAPMNEYVIEK